MPFDPARYPGALTIGRLLELGFRSASAANTELSRWTNQQGAVRIAGTWGAWPPWKEENPMNVAFVAFAAMSVAISTAHAENPLDKLPGIDILPEGTVQISPVVPGMGEHWANPADLPLGPIYCVYEGKVICLEYMISQEDWLLENHGPS